MAEKAKKAKAKKEKTEDLGKEIGVVTHFFDHINVAVVEVSSPIKIGDKVRIKGATTDFEETIKEMQIEHDKIEKAKKGDAIGLKVKDKVRPHDKVYLVK